MTQTAVTGCHVWWSSFVHIFTAVAHQMLLGVCCDW